MRGFRFRSSLKKSLVSWPKTCRPAADEGRPTKLLVTREKKSLVPRLGDTKFCCQLIINITNFYVFKK